MDFGIRGLIVLELVDSEMWWNGLIFLVFLESDWFKLKLVSLEEEVLIEVKVECRLVLES